MFVDYHLIGDRIKKERKKQNYTQEKLAEQLEVSVGYISQVERGITKISLDLLAAISTVLKCDLSLLVTGAAIKSRGYMASELEEHYQGLNARDKKLLWEFLLLLEKFEQNQ